MNTFTPTQQTPTPNATPPNANPWTVKAAGSAEPIPNGAYLATFEGVEPYSNAEKNIADKWRWTWTIAKGPQANKKASALTDQTIKPTTLPGRIISGMAGRALVEGENVKALVDGFKAKAYVITIGPGPKNGKPQVQSANIPPAM